MHRAIRTQVDDKGDEYSLLTAIDFTGSKLITRQEGKEDADVNNLLRRYGIGIPLREGLRYGEMDYTIDLQQAHQSISNAESFWLKLPPELKTKYPTWEHLLRAAGTEQLKADLLALNKKEPTIPPTTNPEETP